MVPILISKDMFDLYNNLKLTVQNHIHACPKLIDGQ